jgi:hypothetical protein
MNTLMHTALVAHGGSENHSVIIDELLQHIPNPSITKIIALKDICFSNLPVEAVNKIIKRYLRHYKPYSFSELEKQITFPVFDYNQKRPHGSLAGLTPAEAYTTSLIPLSFSQEVLKAKAARIAQNRKVACVSCKKNES